LAQGKRVERVEDVLSLGEELDVHVDDIDPIGKVSLSIEDGSGTSTPGTGPSSASLDAPNGADGEGGNGLKTVSFEDTWEQEARSTFGDLGPSAGSPEQASGPSGARGERDRAGEPRGPGGPRRNPRRRH
jgi:polyribonucleotide nucleotidyltransferase